MMSEKLTHKKIAYASVFVRDQDKALDFYTNVLGLEKGIDNPTPGGPRFLTVGVKGQDFQLVLWPGTAGQGQPFRGRVPTGPPAVRGAWDFASSGAQCPVRACHCSSDSFAPGAEQSSGA
jgi:catechol 2,3-dioxygenase-like lactoylglutathione lyase family enzyme